MLIGRDKVRVVWAVLLLPIVFCGTPARAQDTATVDPSVQFQTWQGWGTSLAWWAKVVGGLPEPARQDYMDKAFDPVKGLGLNVIRYNIGGGENPKHLLPNKQFMGFRESIDGYEPSPGKWDWNADAYQRWVLKRAMQMGANHVEAFSNSPPYWMTRSGSVTGDPEGKDNLDPKYNAAFADYLAEVVKHFRDNWGVTFESLEPLNEPSGSWWKMGNHQEGCHVDRPHQNIVIKATGAALARQRVHIPVSASDESVIDDAARTFPYYDATALGYLTRINTHSYGGNARTQVSAYALGAGKDLWLSEYGDSDASGMKMSRRILEDIHGLHPSAWVYWQVVDSSGGWGFLKSPQLNDKDPAYTINKKFYVMGQYSKYIRPGCRMMAISDRNSLAAYDAKSKTLVIVTTNSSAAARPVTFDLSGFSRLGASVTAVRTSPTENWAKLPAVAVTKKTFTVNCSPKSVTTFVIPNAAFTARASWNPFAWYTLKHRQTGQLLEEQGRERNDFTPVVLGKLTPSDDGQQWRILPMGGGIYKLVNRHDGLTLEIGGEKIDPGATADLYHDKADAPGHSSQQWRMTRKSNGDFSFVNTSTGLALAVGTDGVVQQQPVSAKNSPAQQWIVSAVPGG